MPWGFRGGASPTFAAAPSIASRNTFFPSLSSRCNARGKKSGCPAVELEQFRGFRLIRREIRQQERRRAASAPAADRAHERRLHLRQRLHRAARGQPRPECEPHEADWPRKACTIRSVFHSCWSVQSTRRPRRGRQHLRCDAYPRCEPKRDRPWAPVRRAEYHLPRVRLPLGCVPDRLSRDSSCHLPAAVR